MTLAFYDSAAGDSSGLSRLKRDHVTHLAPTGLYLAPDGGLHAVGDAQALTSEAHASGVQVFPVVQNYRDGAFQAGDLRRLASAAVRQSLADDIVRSVMNAGADGVNLDFEQLPSDLAGAYASFVTELSSRLHQSGRKLILDIPVEHRSYDVPRLQATSDWVLLMAYDQHSLPARPGPVAAYPWVLAALQHLREEMPAAKILLGLAGYGYDWAASTVEPLSFREALQRAGSAQRIQWDAAAREPWYTYAAPDGVTHTVWFGDAASLQPLVREAVADGLAGLGVWRLGLEDEALWQLVTAPGARVPAMLSAVSVSPTLSGQGEVAGVTGLPRTGHRLVTMDAAGEQVVGERYLDLPIGVQVRETPLKPGTVALTFDDGPDPRWTPAILDILRRYNAHATFFVIGSQAAQHPDLVARMYAEGHEVANHTFTHAADMVRGPPWRFSFELSMTQRVVEAATGHSATLFRYPYSDSLSDPPQGDQSLFEVAQQGYQVVGSGSVTLDWTRPGAAFIVGRALADPDGQTILLHDGGGDRSQTVAALPSILVGLQGRGLKTVSVGAAIGELPEAAMPAATTASMLLDVPVLWTIWIAGHIHDLWFAAVNLVALAAFARVVLLGGFAFLQWAVSGRPPANPYRGPVTVVVPAHNEERLIARTLDALLRSDYPEVDIVVVDDGSEDRTVPVASSFVRYGIRVIPQPHAGKAKALRVGFAAARHPVVVALDADTVFARSTIRRLVEPFGDPNVGAVAGNPKVGNRDTLLTRFQVLEYVLTLNLERRVYSALRCVPVVPGAVGAWRRRAVAAVGGFTSDTLAEDTDVTLALGRAGYRVRYAPQAVAYTEAPQTLRQLSRQRNRWAFGMLQSLWKHRAGTLNPRAGGIGLVAIPSLWIAQLVFPIVAPTIDLGLLLSPLFAWGPRLLLEVAAYNVALLVLGLWALRVDGEPAYLALLLPLQNLFYRQFMYLVTLKAAIRALKGIRVGWTRVTRLGTFTLREEAR
jgi:peptidoglycan-N-acetylglucosamine deacetylase